MRPKSNLGIRPSFRHPLPWRVSFPACRRFLLGLLRLRLRLRLLFAQHLHRAARLFHRRNGRLRRTIDLEVELALDLAFAEQPHAVMRALEHARLDERLHVDRPARAEMTFVDRDLYAAEIHLAEPAREDVVEPALRQAAMQRHLAAFESLDRDTGARLLTLGAAASGLALARTDAASDAHPVLARALAAGELIEFHRSALPILSSSYPARDRA